MAAFNELLRPVRFDAEPSDPQSGKQFKHWFKTLENFMQSVTAQGQEAQASDKLRLLCAYVSANAYEMIEDCETYETGSPSIRQTTITVRLR